MKKLISFKEIKNICVFEMADECDKLEEQTLNFKCNAKNCPVWKKLGVGYTRGRIMGLREMVENDRTVSKMTDRELFEAVVAKVWIHTPLDSLEGSLIQELLERFKKLVRVSV